MSPQVDSALHSSTLLSGNDDPNRSVTAVAAGSSRGKSQKFWEEKRYSLFVQSTYEGPSYKKLGMMQNLMREQRKRDTEAVMGGWQRHSDSTKVLLPFPVQLIQGINLDFCLYTIPT